MEFLNTTKVPYGIRLMIEGMSYQRVRDDTTYHFKAVGDFKSILKSLKYIIEHRSDELLNIIGLNGELNKIHLVNQILNPMEGILGTTNIELSLRQINRSLILFNEN
jgi:hypothetical protein